MISSYKFDEIAYNITAKRTPCESDMEHYIGLEHLETGNLYVSNYGSKVPIKGDKLIMKTGDILLGKRNAYLRRAAIAPHDGLFSAHGMILRPKIDVIDEDFFPFFIASDYFFDEIIRISVGGLSPTINWKDLKELQFNLPSLEEQKALANKLWAAYSLKESYKRLIKATDEMVKSQFIEMFGSIAENSKHLPQKKLGEVATLLNGRAYKANELLSQGKYIVLRVGNFFTNADYYYSDMELDPDKYCDTGDLLYSWSATLGAQIWSGEKVIYHYHIWKVVFDEAVLNKKYFCYMLNYMTDALKQETHGSTMVHLTKERMEKKLIVVPSLEDQNKFSNILEQADKSKFTSLKSQFIEMFGSNDCECKPLSDLTSLITKGTTPTSVGFNFEEDGIKYIKAENICEDTSINLNDCMHISQDCHNTLKRSQLQNGDLLFSIAGVIGRVGVITKECLPANTNQALAIIRFDTSKEINKEYAKHALLSPFVESQWKMKMRGAAQMNISLKDVGDINIPLPSLANQEQFCQIAEQADKSKYIN